MTKTKFLLCDEKRLYEEEVKRRQALRLQQVREISKQSAAKVREAFKREKDKQVKKLQDNLKRDFEERKEEQIEELEDMVYHRMRHFGEGHQTAENYDDKSEARIATAIENENKAIERGQQALRVHRFDKACKENKENAHIIARQFALEQEKLRAAEIAKLPPPKPDELKKIEEKNVKLVTYHDVNAFMTTHYHMPETMVDKATNSDCVVARNANEEAKDEEKRIKFMDDEKKRCEQERKEKARLRGKHALEKEVLQENYNDFLGELSLLQKADRERRQKELLNIPKEIFVPPWQRKQEKHEMQMELEREFEKIYANADLRQPFPQPVDLSSQELSSNFDSELDLTVLENKEHELLENCEIKDGEERAVRENDNQQQNNNELFANRNNPSQENALKKLLDKIRKQRETAIAKSDSMAMNVELPETSAASTPRQHISPTNNNNNTGHASKSAIETTNGNETAITPLEQGPIDELSATSASSTISNNSDKKKVDVVKSGRVSVATASDRNLVNVSSLNNFRMRDDLQSVIGAPQYSVDLSHASRDPLVSGPQEFMLNKQELQLALINKNKEIERKQKALEEKLRELEEREQEIKYHEMKSSKVLSGTCTPQQAASAAHSSGDSTDRSSQANTNTQPSSRGTIITSDEQAKLREYQQTLLDKHEQKSQIELDSVQRIEMRKKEILKRFGITGVTDLTNFNQNKPASSIHTTSSDSGLGSIQITRTNANLTNRPPLPMPPTTLKDQDTSQDSTLELQSDETALPKRLSTDSTDLSNNSRQFGLEYFDSQNSDIRDPSIEKLIGWVDPNSAKTTPMASKTIKKTESTTDSLLSTSMSSTSSSVSDEHEVVDSFALSRKMIQEQLELIRSQKEELLKSQQSLIGKPIKPPVKSYKSVECNPHELSTIKEEANNTPMSERVARKVPMTAESTSSSLESVSMLNDSTQFKSMNLACDAKYLAKTNGNRVNLSLFDPGSSLENSFFNLSNNLNANSNNNNNSSKSRNSIDDSNNRVYKEYASGVYDYSSVSEKLSQHTINEDSSSGGSLMSLEKRIRNKKWANILMSADEDDTTTATNSENSGDTRLLQCQNLSGSSVSHGPLASDDSIFDNSSAASSYIGFAKINTNNKKTAQRKVAAPVNNESVNNENNSNVMVMMRELSLSESLIKNSNNNESLEKSLKPFSVSVNSPNSSSNPIIIKETIKTLNKSNESVRSEKDLKLMQESSFSNGGNSGIFADFIGKKENLEAFSKTSLMDEPEISFVSIKSCSQSGASPLKDAASTPAAILFTRNQMARLSNSASPINANLTNCNFTKLSNTNTNSESFSSSLSGLKEQKLVDQANFVCLSPNMAESILNSTQIENLLNEDKNNLTMVDYHDATNVFRMSDSLISFERHEKSAVSSPFSTDSFKKPSPPPMKIQNVNKWNDLTNVDENVSQWKVEKSESNGSASQSMGFSYLSQVPLNSTPIVTSNTSSSRGSSGLKSIYENSTNFESTRINTNCYEQSLTKLSPLVNQDSRDVFVENHKKNRIRNLGFANCDLVKRNKGGMGFSIDRNGNFCDLQSFKIAEKNRRTYEAKLTYKKNYEDNNYVGLKKCDTITKKEMHERTARLCKLSVSKRHRDQARAHLDRLQMARLNRKRLAAYVNYLHQRNKQKFFKQRY